MNALPLRLWFSFVSLNNPQYKDRSQPALLERMIRSASNKDLVYAGPLISHVAMPLSNSYHGQFTHPLPPFLNATYTVHLLKGHLDT